VPEPRRRTALVYDERCLAHANPPGGVAFGSLPVDAFRPDLLLVAAGQDAAATDPLGRMSLTVQGFGALCDRAVALADAPCEGRVVAVLEGGYSRRHLALANLATLEGLAGLHASFPRDDPVGVGVPLGLRPEEEAAVEAAAFAHGTVAG